jgi:PAS domain S-box-containing protein
VENLTLDIQDNVESDYRYSQLVYGLPVAVYTCDAQGYVKIFNKAAVELWGREPEIGKDLWCGSWRIYNLDGSPMSLDKCPMAIALKERRAVYGEEIIIERPDGVRRYVQPHPEPIFNESGELVEAVNTLIDITDQKNAELALEKKVEERTSELEKINKQLAHSNSELEQFAYVASHDLQEPLRKIKVFSASVKNNLSEPGKATLYLDKISGSADRMMKLIMELLKFSRLSKKGVELADVDLNDVLRNIKKDLDLFMNEKQANIISDVLPTVQGNLLQLNQLFYNLIINSLKFSGEHVKPVIKIVSRLLSAREVEKNSALIPGSGYFEIKISDNGIGFAQQYAEEIFTMFQRLNNDDTYNGTGIGLALCKKIVLTHHGEIYAISEENKGASFYVLLPQFQPR